jgi:ribonuclease BN (tRNA processing enzyme)
MGVMRFALTCLGTGDAFGSCGRHCAGYLLDTEGGRLLLDAGPSVLGALKAQRREPSEIDGVVLSHLHGDHFGGIPFLFLEYRYESPRTRPLIVAGPPGTEARVFELWYALYADWRNQALSFPVEFIELNDGSTRDILGVRVESFRVPHQKTAVSLGHCLTAGGKRLAYSGDSAWTPELLRRSSGADLFLCECSTFDTFNPTHVRYLDIQANRAAFECRRLLLTHLGREVRERSAEIPDELANDGLKLEL